ncbi:MobF family relaxase [Nakamurella sp. UYEF19]|uniref:MobF family relaxase n=1 Tax=Nakamurella sp. UYEF19 TaxID=1756392 RepID=UPI003398B9D4
MSMVRMSSVDYLTSHIAAGDGSSPRAGSPMTRYYAADGYPPGTWIGSGLTALGDNGLKLGSEVTEQQLRALFEAGCDPITGSKIGSAASAYRTRAQRIERRVAALPETLPELAHSAAIRQIVKEEQDTPTRKAVAGFDLTFSVPKSISALWAVADHGLQIKLYDAHRAALANTLELIENEALFTRTGAQGVARTRTTGMIASAFDHWDSRKGDPQLHTHVTVANRLQGPDGKWRTIDSKSLFRAAVAYSETYNLLLADEVTRRVGINWEGRERGRGRRRARELVGVPDGLLAIFSQRSADIEAAVDIAIDQYVLAHGRRPDARSLNRMRQHYTLDTREQKKSTSLAEAVTMWAARAGKVLAQDPVGWASTVADAALTRPPVMLRADDVPGSATSSMAAQVVDEVASRRSTWTRWNLTAEAVRHMQQANWQFTSAGDAVAVRDRIVTAAETLSVMLTAGQLTPTPDAFRERDGTSRFGRPQVFTSRQVLDAEDRLLTAANSHGGPAVNADRAAVMAQSVLPGRSYRLSIEDQAPAAIIIASSGRIVDVLVGPAGTGKTTSMAGVRAMWESEFGAGSVVGLAPSAKAAEVLASDLGILTDNTAQWLAQQELQGKRTERIALLDRRRHQLRADGVDTTAIDGALADVRAVHARWSLRAGQLLIVDEAGMAGTFALDRLAQQAIAAGAKLLLVGDPHQLSPVETGGAFGLIASARTDAPTLTVVRRFTDADGTRRKWEERAAAEIRLGDADAIDAYLDHGRFLGGAGEAMTDAAYNGWLADTRSGSRSLLIAADNDSVHELNLRARADLVAAGRVKDDRTVRLHDGSPAGRGDIVVTREIDRYLPDGTGAGPGPRAGRRSEGFVRNGQQWSVERARTDGSLTVRLLGADGLAGAAQITLPAHYVAHHVELGYATTAHRAQGMTTDTAHVLAGAAMARETFYVAMTRGRRSNQAYLVTDPPTPGGLSEDGDVHMHGPDAEPWTRREIVQAILANSSAAPSAHEMIRDEQEAAGSIRQLAAEAETIASYAHDVATVEAVYAVLGDHPATQSLIDGADFDELVKASRTARTWGLDVQTGIHQVATRKAPETAGELADQLRAWTNAVTIDQIQPRRLLVAGVLPDATAGLTDQEMLTALNSRYLLIEHRADAVLDRATSEGSLWIAALPAPSAHPTERWRSAARTVAAYRDRWSVTDDRPLGSPPEHGSSFSQRADYRLASQALRALAESVDRPIAASPAGRRFDGRDI